MANRILDLAKTIHEHSQQDPFILEVMREAGFTEITNPLMLRTAGRVMTIPKGATMRGLNLKEVLRAFIRHGYEILGSPADPG